MGNTPTRSDAGGSFRENSKQHREYRALENKIRLLKIQANNYNGIGKDHVYSDMFASVQDTIETVRYLREKSKSSNRKIEYDMLDAELKSCLQILSAKIHNEPVRNSTPIKEAGNNNSDQYGADSIDFRVKQLKISLHQNGNANNLNNLNILESKGRFLYKELENTPQHGNIHLAKNMLQEIMNEIAAKQAELHRKSKYDNLEVNSEPTDPSLLILLKMEKGLTVFKDREYLSGNNLDIQKMMDTLNCYRNDLHSIRSTSKDVATKQAELLTFVESTITYLTDKQKRSTIDRVDSKRETPKEDTFHKIVRELNIIENIARKNSDQDDYLKRILDLLEQVSYSLKIKSPKHNNQLHKSMDNITTDQESVNHDIHSQYRSSVDDLKKAAAKSTLQSALERKGYRKTVLANTMIKNHAAKLKRTSVSDVPEYYLIEEHRSSNSGHRNSFNVSASSFGDRSFVKPHSPNVNRNFNSPSNSERDYQGGSGAQLTPNSGRHPGNDHRPTPQSTGHNNNNVSNNNNNNNKALQEIDNIRWELDRLRRRVDHFADSRQSALYEDLETLLLELLVRLEHVQNDSSAAEASDSLVFTIRDTQKVLYVLDEKALKFKAPNKYAY